MSTETTLQSSWVSSVVLLLEKLTPRILSRVHLANIHATQLCDTCPKLIKRTLCQQYAAQPLDTVHALKHNMNSFAIHTIRTDVIIYVHKQCPEWQPRENVFQQITRYRLHFLVGRQNSINTVPYEQWFLMCGCSVICNIRYVVTQQRNFGVRVVFATAQVTPC